jgi:putative ABC transport system permease protein
VPSDASVVDPVLISDSLAESGELSVGDRVPIEFTTGATRDLTVIGVYSDGVILDGEYLLDDSTWDAVGAEPGIRWLGLSLVDGVTVAQADEVFAPIAADYPQVNIDTSGEFVERLEGFVDSALTVVNAMVALAVIIALVGIANTLALSVFERTRELGLLRAVGMTRRQLRRMVRLEASLVALFGATLGVATGVAFGWAAVLALPESVTSTLSIPVLRIAVLVAVAAAAGLVAAWGPARRASRLDVLDAIAL